MGSVFGKESVKEPKYEVLLERPYYELRQYGVRYAAWVAYEGADNTSAPFRALARYIGVFGTPENEGQKSLSMTAPVTMGKDLEPESISMTAPVVMEGRDATKKMMFMLPEEYDAMDKIPKPTNPIVHIAQVPSEIGVVHRYNGSMDDSANRQKARGLADQLILDGLQITEDYVLDHFQFWGYNPPFTLPYFRRNEIWLKLDAKQVSYLQDKFNSASPGGLPGGSKGRQMSRTGVLGLAIGALTIGLLLKRRNAQHLQV